MGQFPQDGENGQNVAFFLSFWSSAVTKRFEKISNFIVKKQTVWSQQSSIKYFKKMPHFDHFPRPGGNWLFYPYHTKYFLEIFLGIDQEYVRIWSKSGAHNTKKTDDITRCPNFWTS